MRSGATVTLALLLGFCATAEVPDLSGTWAVIQVFRGVAVLPLAGEVPRTSVVAQFVSIEQDGANLTLLGRYCFTDVDDGTPLVETVIPEVFTASLAPTPRAAVLRETDDGVVFDQPAYVEVRGAVLEDPANDPLPDDPLDPRIVDQDGDGRPGMTVRITVLGIVEGETYVVQRVTDRMIGPVIDADRIEGRIEWTDEQSVLAATNPLLEIDTAGGPDSDPAASRFVMVRVDPSWTCETLRERLAAILREEPTG